MQFFLLIISIFLFSCQSFSGLKPKQNLEIINSARQYALEGNFKKAHEEYAKVMNNNSSIDEAIEYAKVLRAGKSISDAILFLEKYHQENPKTSLNAEFNLELGIAYLESGNLSKAEEYLYKTFTIDATNWKAAANIGLINGLQGDYNESRQYFEIALNLSNDNYAVLNNYANIERIAKNPKKAKKLYKKALKQKLPNSVRESIEKQIKEIDSNK